MTGREIIVKIKELKLPKNSYAFASLEEVRRWKFESGGDKHRADVVRIDQYLADNKD